MGTIKKFKPGSAEPLSLSKTDDKTATPNTPPRKKSKMVMAEIKKELYGIPKHLDVDNCRSNIQTNFADRTAQHIKSGLSEVIIDKPVRKNSDTGESPGLKKENPNEILTTSIQSARDASDKSK